MSSLKCHICDKVVYLPEQVKALKKVYHKLCFRCGAGSDDTGCNRKLDIMESYLEHRGDPFCKNCHVKLFAPKGINQGLSGSMMNEPSGSKAELERASDSASTPNPFLKGKGLKSASDRNDVEAAGTGGGGGVARRTSVSDIASKFGTAKSKAPGSGAPKCHLCKKNVYKMEELKEMDRIWHKLCFICSGGHQDGCKRKIDPKIDKYKIHGDEPYCPNCYTDLFIPKPSNHDAVKEDVAQESEGFRERGTVAPASLPTSVLTKLTDKVEKMSTKPVTKAAATMNKIAASSGPTCTVCKKVVYKPEEVKALNHTWHKLCFTCGAGSDNQGCQRKLDIMESYLEHENHPFCKNCHVKLFAPKGINQGLSGSMMNEQTPSTATVTIPERKGFSGGSDRGGSGIGIKVGGNLNREVHQESEFQGDGDEVHDDEWH